MPDAPHGPDLGAGAHGAHDHHRHGHSAGGHGPGGHGPDALGGHGPDPLEPGAASAAERASEGRLSRRMLFGGMLGVAGAFALAGGGAASPALAAVSRPSIISCASWGAAAARSAISMSSTPQRIVVHHTASSNGTGTTLAAAHSIARNIQQWHFARGWPDTGQHFTVARGGYILEGRHRTLEGLATGRSFPIGAHVAGYNSTSLGIETEGTFTSVQPTSAQWSSLVSLCAYLCQTYGIAPSSIVGHRNLGSTLCPGDLLYARLGELRNAVAARLGGGGGGVDTSRPWPNLRRGATGFRVTAAQRLLRHSGRSITIDGSFGPATESVVIAFQRAKGIVADGVIGPQTWESPLAVTLQQGASGAAVQALQGALSARGHSLVVDGSFGPATLSAVRAYQSSRGLAVDGSVGPVTWAHLLR
ncbi:peptidoglycan recognition protein family protein [Agrococcus carbonis]|uniref:Peptidoglycan-binding (PGRP) domain of peptidoglycan hydrolases-containing protein n=1 Tax=Agrococcus carbonis TaxID=684552 RepID=A0A1H1Q5K1_9MICO|nr:N-acetylmuramoyl-L-alanine amidase [Agrococcus carbonis]SDS18686.1 Peptidoglycan-binding (PGRP) domain of peptidoglycan hydrolases-containing protein [Agrococcus carbonis]